jgi:hypothetical protein
MRETRRANSLAARSADGERMDRTVPMAAAQSFHSERKALCWPQSYRSPTSSRGACRAGTCGSRGRAFRSVGGPRSDLNARGCTA